MSKKMNVLFFITDQQRADHLGCAGNPLLKTPNLDRLASESVRFNSAYVANPVCMPNRCCIFTGQYPNTCVRTAGANLPLDIPTFTETLLNEGNYITKAIGKMHINFWARPLSKKFKSPEYTKLWFDPKTHQEMKDNFPKPYYGFDVVDLIVGHGDSCHGDYQDWIREKAPDLLPLMKELRKKNLMEVYRKSPIPEELYPTSYVTDRAIDFLENYSKQEDQENPFFLFCSYPDPHHPVTPPGKWGDMYSPEDIELPKSFNNIDFVKNHKFLGPMLDRPLIRNMIHRSTNEEEARGFIALTYGTLSMIDHSVGQILGTLEKLGLADNTMVIYTSDHGDMAGDQGMILKGLLPFNGILNVPLIWKVPGVSKPGSVSNSLVSSVDFAPTILNLCGIHKKKQPPDMQGVDVTPVLKDPNAQARDFCLIEFDTAKGPNTGGRLKYLVTEKYKLTVYNDLPGYGDLFDRINDPDEMHNLWFDENYKEVRHELVDKLLHEVMNAQSLYPKQQGMA